MVTVDDVRRVVRDLPRSSEHLIADRVKFRVGAVVYVAFSRDEATMGFAYPPPFARLRRGWPWRTTHVRRRAAISAGVSSRSSSGSASANGERAMSA